jgi:hypothetical protein
MEDDERSGHPLAHKIDESVEKVRDLMDSVNLTCYVEILKQLHEAVHRERSEF